MEARPGPHAAEPHSGGVGERLNWLRAGVLGANDGIISTAGLVVGVAGATTDNRAILIAGVAGLVAGALSMAGGEYVSVSTQRDTERALLLKEKRELADMPEAEERELAGIYVEKGLSPELAAEVARELTEKDALRAHAEAELQIDPDNLTSPWQAAWASLVSFALGSLLPLLAIALPPVSLRVWTCAAAVVIGLVITGAVSARLGGAKVKAAVIRNVGVGCLAMVVTYWIGVLFGVTVL
ncbi:Predicted Fe2+/Mn2+ transporter, VIT1/CCC1 family [Actinokineospora alba]|uniref:Predicted Fe2+/Mn2+ transporter, VIT1/CCC1 family n=1 Tax=Actinokineospora alba TaxID=504798 RepID=A0A1H0T1A4_9PSEU|nr:VIT family protein [Actinokineospora alba]TDP66444.1 VIT1/CCC1 family predicted Fe2+/Mn2+ transporter [Actinokineospora alba]SDJ51847.1 Predicted Fe2+/Mn2+ transporter, VIT1/CCC1 family [Actinokineospora alba]SDP47328.1 Predicted Fe2+/Mn2+ transporter, VIT1/CCC1 family [Actinokineospora alba]